MNLTRSKLTQILKVAALAVVLIGIAGYALSRSLPYFRGPEITIFQPIDGSTVSSTTMTVIGRAERINSLKMNDYPIQIDEEGNFRETLIVFPGVNIISFDVTDQFRRADHAELRIFGGQTM